MITVTLLVENTARGTGILGEHGLAWWIDTGSHRVLFDTGQGMALLHNAAVLKADLASADAIVLSHGHYDHAGGLEAALAAARSAALYLHPRAIDPKYSGSDPVFGARRISAPFVEAEGFRHDKRPMLVSREPVEIVPGIWATGEIPRANDYEDTGGPYFLDRGLLHPDPLFDDQALFFRTNQGVVVVLGCAHAGVVNTLDHVMRLTGGKIHTVIGGMHLENASPRRMIETVAGLRRLGVQRLGPVHCTGWKAIGVFQREFPEQYMHCTAGTLLTFKPTPAVLSP